jgi:hypothetical protein
MKIPNLGCLAMIVVPLLLMNEYRTGGLITQPVLNLLTNNRNKIADLCVGKRQLRDACDWRTWYLYNHWAGREDLHLSEVTKEFGNATLYYVANEGGNYFECTLDIEKNIIDICYKLYRIGYRDVRKNDEKPVLFSSILKKDTQINLSFFQKELYEKHYTYEFVSFGLWFNRQGENEINQIVFRAMESD